MHIITGGAGFIGSALLWQLNRLGIEDILIVDNLGTGEKWRNLVKGRYLDYMHRDKFLEKIKGGLLSSNIESVIHLGACSSTTEVDADFLMENNFHYSCAVCRFALEKGARFINASSAATYGGGENGFHDDDVNIVKLRPLNMYGYSKQLFDLWLLRENILSEVASLKFFNVYGPNEYHKGAMASVASKLFTEIEQTGVATLFASENEKFSDGEQERDFVYVKDCVRLIAWLLAEGQRVNGIRNVGLGKANSFNTVAQAVCKAMNRPVRIAYRPMPASIAANYQYYTCADMGWLAEVAYPYEFTSLESGVEDYVRNYLAKPDRYL